MVRALASHQCDPGSNPSIDPICGLSFSPGTPVFPSPQKTNISKFYFDQESGRRRTTLWMGHLQIIYFIYSSPMLYTVEPRNKEPLCNEVLGITISFAYHSNIWKRTSMKCMKPRYSEQTLSVPLSLSLFRCSTVHVNA